MVVVACSDGTTCSSSDDEKLMVTLSNFSVSANGILVPATASKVTSSVTLICCLVPERLSCLSNRFNKSELSKNHQEPLSVHSSVICRLKDGFVCKYV
jgi:hypothetical protein